MTITTDVTTDLGLVRLLISDTDSASPIYSDDQITAFLLLDSNVFRASAIALRSIAVSQVLLLKVIKWLHLATDGAKVADALRELAQSYETRASLADANSGDLFDWAEFVDDPFAQRERLIKEIEREQL